MKWKRDPNSRKMDPIEHKLCIYHGPGHERMRTESYPSTHNDKKKIYIYIRFEINSLHTLMKKKTQKELWIDKEHFLTRSKGGHTHSVTTDSFNWTVQTVSYNWTVQTVSYNWTVQTVNYNWTVQTVNYNWTVQTVNYNWTVQTVSYNWTVQTVSYNWQSKLSVITEQS